MKNFKSKSPVLRQAQDIPLDEGGLSKKKNFIKKTENFKCENCGHEVIGNGYTDHCPKCLWGKHVDEEIPGDRASECGGLMEPIEVSYLSGEFKIHYKCTKCRHEFWVKAADLAKATSSRRPIEEDNRELLMELMVK